MKIFAIVNSLCLKRLKEAGILLKRIKEGLGAEVRLTAHKGHAYSLAKECAGFDTVLAVGGDGTIFEIINGMESIGTKIAIMPIGTANSLAYDLGMESLDKAFDAIKEGVFKEIDLLEVYFNQKGREEHMYITSTAGIGFFADVAKAANSYFKGFGKLCYPTAGLIHSFGKKERICEISLDGASFVKRAFTNMLVNNTAHIGHMQIFKEANPADNKFNVWISTLGTMRQLIWDLSIITGSHFYYPSSKYELSRLEIRFQEPSDMMFDGELFDLITNAEFFISEKKLPVFCRGE